MEAAIHMIREAVGGGVRGRWSCGARDWAMLIDLGKAFGWKPMGATYLPARGAQAGDAQLRHDYVAGAKEDHKQVVSEDAIAWAQSLREARASPHLEAMIDKLVASTKAVSGAPAADATARYTALLDEFVEYAYGGAFSFWVTPAADAADRP